jgi:acyl-CoA dehydrogenase
MKRSSSREFESVFEAIGRNRRFFDLASAFPRENLELIRKAGLLGLSVPEAWGGRGAQISRLVEVSHELGKRCLSTALIWAMHTQQVDTLIQFASAQLCSEVMPKLLEGSAYLASVTTESNSGGLLRPESRAKAVQGGGWELVREAPVVTGAEHADGFLVTTHLHEGGVSQEASLVYVRRESASIRVNEANWSPMGMKATDSRGLVLTAQVRESDVIGGVGEFRKVAVESMVPLAHLLWASAWLGAAQACVANVVAQSRSAAANSTRSGRSELVLHRLGQMRVELELLRSQVRAVTNLINESRRCNESLANRSAQSAINALKVAAASRSFWISDTALEMSGFSRGYFGEDGGWSEHAFRDLRSASLNYSNDRILSVMGTMTLVDRGGDLDTTHIDSLDSGKERNGK